MSTLPTKPSKRLGVHGCVENHSRGDNIAYSDERFFIEHEYCGRTTIVDLKLCMRQTLPWLHSDNLGLVIDLAVCRTVYMMISHRSQL